jgi:hypothetical protein
MGVGPLHSIGEVAEGNEAMERKERQEGITMEHAKSRTQRWQPLLPNLRRVTEAPDALARHGLRHCSITSTSPRSNERSGGKDEQSGPGVDRVTVDAYERC